MKHVEDMTALIRTMQQSTVFHALVIQSPPGLGKSSTVDKILRELNVPCVTLGSHASALGLYNAICENSEKTIVLDDSGLFYDHTAMAVLKAATWTGVGNDGSRRITWNTTSEKVKAPFVDFGGKLILLTNSVPKGAETEAFLSRTLYLSFAIDFEELSRILLEAAQVPGNYENPELAMSVATHLIDTKSEQNYRQLNLRTLRMGYEVARANPERWEHLLERLLPTTSPKEMIKQLDNGSLNREGQARQFMQTTGLSRRTFYKYRKEETGNKESTTTSLI